MEIAMPMLLSLAVWLRVKWLDACVLGRVAKLELEGECGAPCTMLYSWLMPCISTSSCPSTSSCDRSEFPKAVVWGRVGDCKWLPPVLV